MLGAEMQFVASIEEKRGARCLKHLRVLTHQNKNMSIEMTTYTLLHNRLQQGTRKEEQQNRDASAK
jgi:hypothetical protein